jgi:hypothetical protein
MQIHQAIWEKFNVEWRQCDRYISRLTRDKPDENKDEQKEVP